MAEDQYAASVESFEEQIQAAVAAVSAAVNTAVSAGIEPSEIHSGVSAPLADTPNAVDDGQYESNNGTDLNSAPDEAGAAPAEEQLVAADETAPERAAASIQETDAVPQEDMPRVSQEGHALLAQPGDDVSPKGEDSILGIKREREEVRDAGPNGVIEEAQPPALPAPAGNVEEEKVEERAGAGGAEAKRWPGWPGENVFRLVVPVSRVGGLIGRRGEFVKKLCETTRARIKILEGVPGTDERVVLIYAKEEPDAEASPAMDAFIKVHRRIIEGVDATGEAAGPPAGSVTARMLLAATQAGSLIGRQGATIKGIQDAASCIVRVLPSEDLPPYALEDDRVVEVTGEALAVQRGLELIVAHLRRFLCDRSVIWQFEKTRAPERAAGAQQYGVALPPAYDFTRTQAQAHGQPPPRPPGGGGPSYFNSSYNPAPAYALQASFDQAQNAYSNPRQQPPPVQPAPPAAMAFGGRPPPSYQPAPPQQPPGADVAPSHQQQQQQQQQHQQQQLQQLQQFALSQYQPAAVAAAAAPPAAAPAPAPSLMAPPSAMTATVTSSMQIPLSYADVIIGAEGANISYLRRTSGATVTILESRDGAGNPDMTIQMKGSTQQVMTAQKIIEELTSGSNAAPSAITYSTQPQATQQQFSQSQYAQPAPAASNTAAAPAATAAAPVYGTGQPQSQAYDFIGYYNTPPQGAAAPSTAQTGQYQSNYGY